MKSKYDWLEFSYRPKKDGLHDSGYRFIRLVGVNRTDTSVEKTELHQWSDHVVLEGPVNIDVQEDGTVRIMPWSGGPWVNRDHDGSYHSSAMFGPADVDQAVQYMRVVST